MPRTLAQWLDYQQHTHKRDIDLGLERVRTVWQKMGAPRAPLAITVGGTNGKGSTVAFLTAMLRAAGRHTGTYTSPHVRIYNERICVDAEPVDDTALCAAFERIEQARAEIPLTYYEFATLAALDVFARENVDVMVLEVGLGGRLDATNIVDADAVAITTVDLDHMQYLGPDRDSIGREKAGIARAGRPAIVGDADPPQGLLDALAGMGAEVIRAGRDFDLAKAAAGVCWKHADGMQVALPTLALDAPCQQANAATALALLHALGSRLPAQPEAWCHGLRHARLEGRLQRLGDAPLRVVDVAHNPQAARVLARWLGAHRGPGRVLAVYGALGDKDIAGVVQSVGGQVTRWYLGGLEAVTPRGLDADELASQVNTGASRTDVRLHADIHAAWRAACADAGPDDVVVAFGSFFVVSAVLALSG